MRYISTILFVLLAGYNLEAQSLYLQLDYTDFRDYEEFNEVIDITDFDTELLNACIFFATNEIRVKHKLSVLAYHSALEKAATIQSTDMAENNFFGHTNKKNKEHREPEDRARIAGITNPYIAENIVEGFILNYSSNMGVIAQEPGMFIFADTREKLKARTYLNLTDELLKMWMGSEGHRKNILSDKALQLGCGTALFFMKDFNEMPAVKATQCFQWHQEIR